MKTFTNIYKNYQRQKEPFGDVHFISFLSATLSRISYQNDNDFLKSYTSIMGPVINREILDCINKVPSTNLEELLDDEKIFGLKKPDNKFKDNTYKYKEKLYIDFIKLNMPQNINIINKELKGNIEYKIQGSRPANEQVKYISIGWSNYGEVYIVADKRMSNTIFLLFRGTYSSKTAGLYSKPTSITPLSPCVVNEQKFLYGIYKPTIEMIHTIIETMRYLATNFLEATTPDSVKIFTTGHSLGGAMCTIFAYLWMSIQNTAPYNGQPYNVLAKNIICVSLGAPRVMNASVAKHFCDFVAKKKILFLRITTRGDPVPGLPKKFGGYQHPCSENEEMRKQISEDCNEMLSVIDVRSGSGSGGVARVKYDKDLDCTNEKTRPYFPNALSHTIYLYIKYTSAVDIINFIAGVFIAKEVTRGQGGTTFCRIVMGSNIETEVELTARPAHTYTLAPTSTPTPTPAHTYTHAAKINPLGTSKTGFFVIFVSVQKARPEGSPIGIDAEMESQMAKEVGEKVEGDGEIEGDRLAGSAGGGIFGNIASKVKGVASKVKIGGEVAQDVKMTFNAYNKLIQAMKPLEGDLCPQLGEDINPFTQEMAPKLGCEALQKGGRRQRTRRYKKCSTNKRNTRKRNKRNKRHNTRKH